MVVRMRSTRSHTGNRRSHHALKVVGSFKCENCGKAKLPHRMCASCGNYKGKLVKDTLAKVAKASKKKEKSK
jgi:large subunit ribosomal protein L32